MRCSTGGCWAWTTERKKRGRCGSKTYGEAAAGWVFGEACNQKGKWKKMRCWDEGKSGSSGELHVEERLHIFLLSDVSGTVCAIRRLVAIGTMNKLWSFVSKEKITGYLENTSQGSSWNCYPTILFCPFRQIVCAMTTDMHKTDVIHVHFILSEFWVLFFKEAISVRICWERLIEPCTSVYVCVWGWDWIKSMCCEMTVKEQLLWKRPFQLDYSGNAESTSINATSVSPCTTHPCVTSSKHKSTEKCQSCTLDTSIYSKCVMFTGCQHQ